MAYRIPKFVCLTHNSTANKIGFGPEVKKGNKYHVEAILKHPITSHLIGVEFCLDKKWRPVDYDRLRLMGSDILKQLDCLCVSCKPELQNNVGE